jgi:hypothetical protein
MQDIGIVMDTDPKKIDAKFKKDKALELKRMAERDKEFVTGVFRYYELPGGALEFCLKLYKDEPVRKYNLVDGGIYKLPRGVARHLTQNGFYPVYNFVKGDQVLGNAATGYAPDSLGGTFGKNQVMKVVSKVRRYGFESMEFMDDLETNISRVVEVENAA